MPTCAAGVANLLKDGRCNASAARPPKRFPRLWLDAGWLLPKELSSPVGQLRADVAGVN